MSPSPAQERLHAAAIAAAEAEPQIALNLGIILLVGMEAINQSERFTGIGGEIQNTFHTHFEYGDATWEIMLTKRSKGDG